MAEGDLLSGFNMSNLTAGMDAVSTVIIYFLIAAAVTAILWGCLYLLSFRHKVRIRQKTGSGYVIIDSKAREFRTKDGVTKWRILKYIQRAVQAPESTYLELTKKGKFSAECDRAVDGTITWRKRNDEGKPDLFSTEERTMALMEMRKAQDYLKQGWGDKLMALAPVLAILMILTIFMVFFGEVVAPMKDTASSIGGAAEQIGQASARLSEACLNRPVIDGETGKSNQILDTAPG